MASVITGKRSTRRPRSSAGDHAPKIIATLMYQGLTYASSGWTFRVEHFPKSSAAARCGRCLVPRVPPNHRHHHTICTSKNGTAMANCLRHFSVQLKVPSSIFSWSSFSTRCPSQKYFEQKARQDSFGVRFRTGAASWTSSLGSWCLGLRAAILLLRLLGRVCLLSRDALAAEDGLEMSQLAAEVGDLGLPARR